MKIVNDTIVDIIISDKSLSPAIANHISFRFATSKHRDKYAMNYIGCEGNESSIEDCNHRKFDWIDKGNTANVMCADHGK